MRQKVTKYPGKDLIVITWAGRPESQPTATDLFKEQVFNLTEKHYYDMKLGRKDFLIQLNSIVQKFSKIAL